jgi:hypothetical protein
MTMRMTPSGPKTRSRMMSAAGAVPEVPTADDAPTIASTVGVVLGDAGVIA